MLEYGVGISKFFGKSLKNELLTASYSLAGWKSAMWYTTHFYNK